LYEEGTANNPMLFISIFMEIQIFVCSIDVTAQRKVSPEKLKFSQLFRKVSPFYGT
jgi:hypothetical protein